MATPYTNSVPLGREGTGAAQIFGPSRALQYWLGVSQRDQDRLQSQQDQIARQQMANNNQFRRDINDYQSKISSPWWNTDLTERAKVLSTQGAEFMARGVNPYSGSIDPKDNENLVNWRGDWNTLLGQQAGISDLKKQTDAIVADYNKNPTKYRREDIQQLINTPKNFTYQDFVDGKVQLPNIQPIVRFDQEGANSKFGATVQTVEETVGNDGIRQTQIVTKPNEELLLSRTETAFRSNPQYINEVNKRLEEKGYDTNVQSLFQTTNKDELRTLIDARLRAVNAPQELDANGNPIVNPVVQLAANGSIPSFDSKEYQDFLDEAVDEQVKAEKVLHDAKDEFMIGAQSNIDQKYQVKYDDIIARNRRANDSARMARERQNAYLRNQSLSAEIKRMKIAGTLPDSAEEYMEDSEDTPLNTSQDGATLTSYNTIPYSSSTVSINATNVWDTKTGKSKTSKPIRGSVSGIGMVGLDKDGNIIEGSNPDELLGNPNVKEFRTVALVQNTSSSIKRNEPYPISSIPSSSFSGPKKKDWDSKLETQKAATKEYNNRLKATSSGTNKKPKFN